MPDDRKPPPPKPGKPRRPFGCVETAAFLALAALVLGGWLVPSALFRLSYGHGPVGDAALRKVQAGMTADEVIAAVGPPHKKHREGERERWIYFKDSFRWGSAEVRFDAEGRVEGVWSDE
jgi:hypothetical protein